MSLGQTPAIEQLQRQLYKQLTGQVMRSGDDMDADSQLQELQKASQDKRWLVVPDVSVNCLSV